MHVQRDVRIMLNKTLDDRRQCIAGLGMGGGNRKAALLFFSKLLRYLTNTFDLKQHLFSCLQYSLPGRRDVRKMLAAAGEDLDT